MAKKKIGELTKEERKKICSKYMKQVNPFINPYSCTETCPLFVNNKCNVDNVTGMTKEELNTLVEVEQ